MELQVHPGRQVTSATGEAKRWGHRNFTRARISPRDDKRGVSSGVEPGREEKSSTQGHVPEAPGDNGSQDRAMSSYIRVEMWAAPGRWVWLATPEE